MSHHPLIAGHEAAKSSPDAIATVIVARTRDVEGFAVRRALPAPGRRMVGPFIFLDQVGPGELIDGQGIDIRPHPHIGLATLTYLFEGEFHHRDSTGADQIIRPGDVNWMVAGRGVTHSERTDSQTRTGRRLPSGIQSWVALPQDQEDSDAAFQHHGRSGIPLLDAPGIKVRLIAGTAWGESSPVTTSSRLFYCDVAAGPGIAMPLPHDHEDRAIYIMDGSIDVGGQEFRVGQMVVFRPGDAITVRAGPGGARFLALGGDTLEGPRHIWWNFVASSRERIEAAKAQWRSGDFQRGQFRLPPGDDDEFVPAPVR
ncbi:MAG: pirin family protein [Rhizobiaceae bacterium]